MLKVTVGDLTIWVVLGDEVSLDVVWERKLPDVGLFVVVQVDTTHSNFGGVGGSKKCWCLRDYLGEVSGSLAQAGSQ